MPYGCGAVLYAGCCQRKASAEDAKETIATLEVKAETLEEGKDATATAELVEGKLIITIGIPKGDKGDTGETGADGTVSFDDLTDEQKESLKGEKGDSFTFEDFTDEELEELQSNIVDSVLEHFPVAEEESF